MTKRAAFRPQLCRDARRRRMQAHLQGVEIQRTADLDDEFAIESELLYLKIFEGHFDFRKEAVQRTRPICPLARHAPLLQSKAAEAVPLGLEYRHAPVGSSSALLASIGNNSVAALRETRPSCKPSSPGRTSAENLELRLA